MKIKSCQNLLLKSVALTKIEDHQETSQPDGSLILNMEVAQGSGMVEKEETEIILKPKKTAMKSALCLKGKKLATCLPFQDLVKHTILVMLTNPIQGSVNSLFMEDA